MEVIWQNTEMKSRARCLLHGQNKIYLSRNRHRLSTHTQRWRHTQSEPNKRETFFNQRPTNLQAEVRSYVLYKYNKYSYKRLISGCLFTIDKSHIGERQIPHIIQLHKDCIFESCCLLSGEPTQNRYLHYDVIIIKMPEIKLCIYLPYQCSGDNGIFNHL
jgi:hypothetical protein